MAKNLLAQLEDDIELAQDLAFSTEDINCPVGEFPGVITKVARRTFTSGENTFFMLNVTWSIDDPEVREHCKRDKVFVQQDMFLELDEEHSRFMDEEDAEDQLWVIPGTGNAGFGRFMKWAEDAGYDRPTGWAKFWVTLEDSLKGKEALLRVRERLQKTKDLDDEGNPVMVYRSYIDKVAKA